MLPFGNISERIFTHTASHYACKHTTILAVWQGRKCRLRAARAKGDILFHEREYPPLNPPRERFRLAVSGLNNLYAFGMQLPARGAAAFEAAIRFASASTTRCRSAHLVEVQPNFRLPGRPSMRRAKQCRYFARSLPPCYRHSRLTIVRRGCNRCRIAGIHGEAMYTAPDCAACAALQAANQQCEFSLGGVRGISFEKEMPLLYPHPARRREWMQRCALPISLPLRENNQPGGQVMSRPESTWKCRCGTLCPACSPMLDTTR